MRKSKFVRDLSSVHEVNLLPNHRFGKGKNERLGLEHVRGDVSLTYE